MYCETCGVELEPGVDRCPLCGSIEGVSEDPRLREYAAGDPQPVQPLLRRLLRRATGAVTATAVLILLIVDIGSNAGVTWSPLAIVPVLASGAIVAIIVSTRRWWPGYAGFLATVIVMLGLLDVLADQVSDWFVPVALPIVATLGVLAAVVRSVFRGHSAAVGTAAVLLGVGVLTAMIDATVHVYTGGRADLSWSLVVLVSTVPTAGLLVALHQTVLRFVDLRRRFHI